MGETVEFDRVVIVHGFGATPSDHWFGWLAGRLEPGGAEVAVPALPNTLNPDPEAWISAVTDAIGTPDDRTAVVGHSLGCVTVLRALGRLDSSWRLGALVLVAGFARPLPDLPQLDPFTANLPDLDRVSTRVDMRSVVRSDNDTIVPPAATAALGELLDAEQLVVRGAGHFVASEGVTTVPEVAALLMRSRGPINSSSDHSPL
jgi:predicted alpha/beta hydrolase family esterase